jgi:hypothetical protein
MTGPDVEYLRETLADIASLPEPLARAANVRDHGEAEWPRHMAEEVIRALISLGRVVNVLMYAKFEGDRLSEANPISTYEGDSADDNLRWILPGLEYLSGSMSAVVCWYPGARR